MDRLNSAAEDLEAKSLLGGSLAPQFPHSPVFDLGVLTCKMSQNIVFFLFLWIVRISIPSGNWLKIFLYLSLCKKSGSSARKTLSR